VKEKTECVGSDCSKHSTAAQHKSSAQFLFPPLEFKGIIKNLVAIEGALKFIGKVSILVKERKD
jgi:hypothetical protein